jgi:hypothetical protein
MGQIVFGIMPCELGRREYINVDLFRPSAGLLDLWGHI